MERMKLDPSTLKVESFTTPREMAVEQMQPTTTVQSKYQTCLCPTLAC